jgi:hypothetical protein
MNPEKEFACARSSVRSLSPCVSSSCPFTRSRGGSDLDDLARVVRVADSQIALEGHAIVAVSIGAFASRHS